MPRKSSALAVAFVMSAVTAACQSDLTELVVVVDADTHTREAATRYEVRVEGAQAGPVVDSTDLLPATIGLVSTNDSRSIADITASALDAAGGVVVMRRVRTQFVPGESRLVYLWLASNCAAVSCASEESCDPATGACAAIDVDGGALPTWDGTIPPAPEPMGLPPEPRPETCNGLDDDLDGSVDEDFSLDDDLLNCGACGHACPPRTSGDPVCDRGTCRVTCRAGFHTCATECVADADPMHCGPGCVVCPTGARGDASCAGGTCRFDCDAGFADCDHDLHDGCEADLSSHDTCGACGVTCAASELCATSAGGGFACVPRCPSGTTECDGSCVDLASTPGDCGGCGMACPDTGDGSPVCTASTCSLTCDRGFHLCDGTRCADSTSLDSCGAACMPCPARPSSTPTCDSGTGPTPQCGFDCDPGWGDCDGIAENGCEQTLAAPTACGSCDNDCVAAHATTGCASGACTYTCLPGFRDCNGLASDGCEVDTRTDSMNCGTCGTSCTLSVSAPHVVGMACMSSACALVCATGYYDCDLVLSNGCEATSTSTCRAPPGT